MARKLSASKSISIKRVPGKHRSFLETERFSQSVKVRLPVLTVTGAQPGPLAVIMAGQHGRELNGIAGIEQVFNALDPHKLNGTVVFLPVMNPIGVLTRRQDYPTEEFRYRRVGLDMLTPRGLGPERNYNMDLSWLDKPTADTYAFAVTQTVWENYLRHADWSIDFHGWTSASVSLAWSMKKHADFLRNFGMPWHRLRKPEQLPADGGMSLCAANRDAIPHIVAELTPQNMLDPVTVGYARRGVLNSLIFHGMLKGKPELPKVQYEMVQGARETSFQAGAEGLLVSEVERGNLVKKGQLIARVVSLETFETVWSCKAPYDGLVFREARALWGEDVREHSIVYPGMRVVTISKLAKVIRRR